MASWKTWNEVPDSDEEEEDPDSQGGQIHDAAPDGKGDQRITSHDVPSDDSEDELALPGPALRLSKKSSPQSSAPQPRSLSDTVIQDGTQDVVAVKLHLQEPHLETDKSLGEHVVQDVVCPASKGSPPRDQVTDPILVSSPLTELTSSPPETWTQPNVSQQRMGNTTAAEEIDQEIPLLSNGDNELLAEPQRRSKRKRNAIQLNPYRVENQMYRQSIQRAGIAPVRIQDRYELEDDANDEYHPDPMRDTQEAARPDFLNGDSLNFNISFDDDEPPDLEVLLAAQAKTRISGTPTAKSGKLQSRKRRRSSAIALNNNGDGSATQDDRSNNATSMFDIPSPPPSSEDPNSYRRSPKIFRYTPGTTPQQLRTPAVSSELRLHDQGSVVQDIHDNDFNVLSDAEDDVWRSRSRTMVHDTSTARDVPDEEESYDEADVRSVRRRIKGVLPASWLRFDRQKQIQSIDKIPPKPPRTNSSPTKFHKGIARPLPKRRGSPLQQSAAALIVSDDSETETVPQRFDAPLSIESPSKAPAMSAEVIDVDTDSMEEDHIDQMLPSKPRERRSKGQYRIFKPARSPRSARKQSRRQTKIYDHVQRQAHQGTARRTPPKDLSLSILDTVSTTRTSPLPDFLRVALRTTKPRRDRGVQLPHSKVVQIEPSERDTDAEDTLRAWKTQNMEAFRSRARQQPQTRPPLRPASGNARTKRSHGQLKHAGRAAQFHVRSGDLLSDQDSLAKTLSRKGNHSTASIESRSGIPKPPATIRDIRNSHKISSNVFQLEQVLPGQLEDLASSNSMPGPADRMTSAPAQRTRATVVDKTPILNRYFDDHAVANELPSPGGSQHADIDKPRPVSRRLVRKRHPRHVPIRLPAVPAEYQYLSGPCQDSEQPEEASARLEGNNLGDLGSYGHEYTWDFDIDPLPRGSFIGPSSLLEEAYIQRILNVHGVTNSIATPRERTTLCSRIGDLHGPWNEEVATKVDEYLHGLRDFILEAESGKDMHEQALRGIRAVNLYLAESIYFLDSIDRADCLERLRSLLQVVSERLSHQLSERAKHTHSERGGETALLSLSAEILILSYQLVVLSQDEVISEDLKKSTNDTCGQLLQLTVKQTFQDGVTDFYQYQQALNNCSGHWVSDSCRAKANTLIILNHISRLLDSTSGIWKYLQVLEPFSFSNGLRNVVALERKWFNFFAVMPFLEVETSGQVPQSRPKSCGAAGWSYVLRLLQPVISMYEQERSQQAPMLNDYYRALLGRCLVLINKWGWTDCEVVLRALYDAFAKNNLHNLPCEDTVGYPQFLTNFKASSLVLDRSDKAFHIFIKIIGAGLLRMVEEYPEKKLRSIAFRLTPNHSRSLPKEEALRQEELDALRNHHNLLCLLYIVLPNKCRPRLGLVQDLIRVEDSHRRACHINVRTWTDLTLFQLSTQEPVTALEPLSVWYDDLLGQLVRQHALARKEVEAHEDILSAELRETMIASNQRQVEAVLCDALHSLQLCIRQSRTMDNVNVLLTKSFAHVVGLFNPKISRTNSVLLEALNVVKSFLMHGETLASNSESQDFGDWSAFDEYIPARVGTSLDFPDWLIAALHALLSSCLGSTDAIDDQFTAQVVTTWVSMAYHLVKSGTREWSDFVDQYGQHSWFSFLQTDRTAKLTPLFLALVVEMDPVAYDQHQSIIIKSWIDSLVEREALLKYQARLTTAILNQDAGHPLLENPPFWRNKTNDQFEISTSDLALRRRALISCILSNMAESVLFSTYHNLPDTQSRRYEYADILKTMMKAMKDKYTALGTGVEVRGAYVEFVQEVAGLLQQHTNHIQPIDRFFLDAKNFPLPVHDPGYVVSRLRSYQLKLAESHGPKQLVAFVQTITERAVMDGSHAYLIDQLRMALSNTIEDGNHSRPTLRAFMLKSVLPAYVDAAVDLPCGWLLASPLLEALRDVVTHVLEDMDAANPASVGAVLVSLATLLHHFYTSLRRFIDSSIGGSGSFTQPATARLLSLVYGMITANLRPLDYCIRLARRRESDSSATLLSCIGGMADLAALALAQMLGKSTHAVLPPPLQEAGETDPALAYAASGLRTALSKWTMAATASGENTYEVRGVGGALRPVTSGLLPFEEERDALLAQLRGFEGALSALPAFAPLLREKYWKWEGVRGTADRARTSFLGHGSISAGV